MEKNLDSLDKRLIRLLSEDGRMSVGDISERLAVTNPTVRSRMKNLIQSGILKIVGLIDSSKAKRITLGIVGITLQRHQELDEKIEQISNLDKVHWAAVVTGRYDIIAEVILVEPMEDLYRFLTEDLPQLGGIRSSESFMVMKAKRKWIFLPRGIKDW